MPLLHYYELLMVLIVRVYDLRKYMSTDIGVSTTSISSEWWMCLVYVRIAFYRETNKHYIPVGVLLYYTWYLVPGMSYVCPPVLIIIII